MNTKNNFSSAIAKFIIVSVFMVLFATSVPVYAGTPTIVSAKISGINTVTIFFSEPVTTTISDYSNFAGALAGQSISALSGSGTATITLTFNGNNFLPSGNGSFSIASTAVSTSDRTSFSGSSTIQVADGQAPSVSSFTLSSNNANNVFAKAGNVLTLTFSTNELVSNPTVTIAGQSVSVSGIGAGPFSSSYILSQNDVQNSIPITINIIDAYGNGSRMSFSVANNAAAGIATITSNASTAGALKVGDSIIFTLVPGNPIPNAKVSGSYNGVSLYWTTANAGATYTATYTVGNTDKDQSTALQISNVVITDQSGNQSAASSGSDVKKIISVSMPIITEITPVPSVVNTTMPIYTFSSTKEGTIQYSGDCTSPILSAALGVNTVMFAKMANGFHSNCSLTVTDLAGNVSNRIYLSGFTVSTGSATTQQASVINYIVAPAPTPITTSVTTPVSSTPVATPVITPVATNYIFTIPLKSGSAGNEVRELQKKLTSEGVYSGPVNGNFGPLTQAAVKKFQKIHGLEQLGSVGPGTRSALNQ